MKKTLQELADILQGTLETNQPDFVISGVNGLEEAGEEDISFAITSRGFGFRR